METPNSLCLNALINTEYLENANDWISMLEL